MTTLPMLRPRLHYHAPLLSVLALLLLLTAISIARRPDGSQTPTADLSWGLPLAFVPNEGQTDPAARYLAQGMGGNLFFSSDGVMLSLPISDEENYALQLRFEGAGTATVAGDVPIGGMVSYFLGNDPAEWKAGLNTYGAVRYEGLYPGVTLRYDGADGRLKGTYDLAAGANPALIRWRYEGAESVAVTDSGALRITLPDNAGTLTEEAPVAWQTVDGARVPVPVSYEISASGSIGFALPDGYDPAHVLTLDPTITYASRLGGTLGEMGNEIAVGSSGEVYITGQTSSPDYPATPGVVQTQINGFEDAFVTKLSPDGATVVYSTYLGGEDLETGFSIAVDGEGNAYVAGNTDSEMFPTTPGSFQPAINGYSDIFVAKLNPTGTAFGYSTYLGGTSHEYGRPAIAVDTLGRAYVTGLTWSATSFPLENPIQAQGRGHDDAFVTVFEPDGASLYFSTYHGGSLPDAGTGITVDSQGMIYITGATGSYNGFPLVNPYQASYGGSVRDAFVAKINPVAPALLYSTYVGGTGMDEADDIVVDELGNATITGMTNSADFPTRFPEQGFGGDFDAFVTQLSPVGDALNFSTFLGGSARDEAEALASDPQGYLYVSGSTTSDNFPVNEPVQATRGGDFDAFVARYFPGGTVDYASYLGGSDTEHSYGIAADASQNAYIVGYTRSDNFPELPPPNGTWQDVFVVKLAGEPGATPTARASGTPTNTATPTASGTPPTATPTLACETNTVMSTDVPKPILDDDTITSTLVFPEASAIDEVRALDMVITHTYPGDLDVYLTSPSGTRVLLFANVCNTNDWTTSNTGFDLWDGAATEMGTDCPPNQATYRPRHPLSAFIGQEPEGTWTLTVTDDLASDTGTLVSWGIQASTGACGTPTATGTATAVPTATPTGNPSVTATPTAQTPVSPTATGAPGNTPTATVPPGTLTVSSVTPTQGTVDVPVTLDIIGMGFLSGINVALASGGVPVTLEGVTVLDETHLRATVPAGIAPGLYTLTVTNPDGATASLPDAYSALAPNANGDLYASTFDFWTDPLTLREGQPVPSYLGLTLRRMGGSGPLASVEVDFYNGNPTAGGTYIGRGIVPILPPHGHANTTRVAWEAPAGNYSLYVVIDPANRVAETLESNNTLVRDVTVLPAGGAPDISAPEVTGFTVNGGNGQTQSTTVALDTSATDNPGGTGVTSLLHIEYEFSQAVNDWVPVAFSDTNDDNYPDWTPYDSTHAGYMWTLLATPGVRYLQVWVADGAGNISLAPGSGYVNYLPPEFHVAAGQVTVVRRWLAAGEVLRARLISNSGDGDLYVWRPDGSAQAVMVDGATEMAQFTASVAGLYQFEVEGRTSASVRLEFPVTGQTGGAPATNRRQVPVVAPASIPGAAVGLPGAPNMMRALYLPLVQGR